MVLVLGAGASIGAQTSNGEPPIIGLGLRDTLSQHFLGGDFGEEQLQWVAELAISATDLGRVQDFIANQFVDFEPAEFHRLLPTFKWRGLATTNYDRLIERTYEVVDDAVQQLVPFISNRDRIDDKLRSPDHVGLLKLHGCITITHDPDLPLILTTDQYATHRARRERLFRILLEWAAENTVVFIGQALQDYDLRTILLQIADELDYRPRYYLVRPGVSETEKNLWATRNITVLDGTYEEFLLALNTAVPANRRALVRAADTEHPIVRRFVVTGSLASPIRDLLYNDVQYVHSTLEYERAESERFYRGFDLGWYPIIEGLDVRRHLRDTVLYDVITRPEGDRPTQTELYVVKAEAGAGKSVFLRRVAWEAATQSEALVLYTRTWGAPKFEALQELHRVTKERIFLFIDSAVDNIALISHLIGQARGHSLPLTIITAERVNEWNMLCNDIARYVSDEYQLPYLVRSEIESLVALLRDNGALGPNLRDKSQEQQIREFEVGAGRQLLVALHEATMGRPFEEILLDEYQNVHPQEAQSLYLTVCFLNRLNVPVRAGLIARVHDISFTKFRERFFAPLEHVVQVRMNRATRDYAYVARHPEIAQIVFQHVLSESTDRYNEYVRILKYLNVAYSSDRESFRKLVRARVLNDLFRSREDVLAIFEIAEESTGKEAYLYQQMAIYERMNSNYSRAHELLQAAQELDPQDTSVIHTMADLARIRANAASLPLERRRFRNEAYSILNDLPYQSQTDRYAAHTFVLLAKDILQDLLSDRESTNRDIDEAVRNVERALDEGRQRFPEETLFKTAEADFARLISDDDRAARALEWAFRANPRDPYIATRLARMYERRGEFESATDVLRKAVENNSTDKQLNYSYAELLRVTNPSDTDNLAYHFRRAFTKWDSNHEAQFWYARYAFDSEDVEKRREAKQIFRRLRDVPMHHEARHRLRDRIKDNGTPRRFTGTVVRIEMTHGFVMTDGRGDEIFFHRNDVGRDTWDRLGTQSRVAFNIGFTFAGPSALQVEAT